MAFGRKSSYPPSYSQRVVGWISMQLFTWTTQDVPRHDSFHYWREAVCRAGVDVSTVQPRETDFPAEIAPPTTDLLTYISFPSSGHDIHRDETSPAPAPEESYLLSL